MKFIEGQFIKTVKGHGKILRVTPTHFGYHFQIELANGDKVNCHESDVVKDTP